MPRCAAPLIVALWCAGAQGNGIPDCDDGTSDSSPYVPRAQLWTEAQAQSQRMAALLSQQAEILLGPGCGVKPAPAPIDPDDRAIGTQPARHFIPCDIDGGDVSVHASLAKLPQLLDTHQGLLALQMLLWCHETGSS